MNKKPIKKSNEKLASASTAEKPLPLHSAVGRILHWVTGLLILYGFATGVPNIRRLSEPGLVYTETVFALFLGVLLAIRYIWMKKYNGGATRLPNAASKKQKKMVWIGHTAIYASLAGVIISGLLIAAVFVYLPSGTLLLNLFVALHLTSVFLAGVLMAGHVAFALYHKYWLKDGIMETMTSLKR